MKVKTNELIGVALDLAVAECEGYTGFHSIPNRMEHEPQWAMIPPRSAYGAVEMCELCFSTDWAQGGAIIEREKITLVCAEGDYNPAKAGTPDCYDTYWLADIGRLRAETVYGSQGDDFGRQFQIEEHSIAGPTPLIAAMRCYVASKLGDIVEIPDEVLK